MVRAEQLLNPSAAPLPQVPKVLQEVPGLTRKVIAKDVSEGVTQWKCKDDTKNVVATIDQVVTIRQKSESRGEAGFTDQTDLLV